MEAMMILTPAQRLDDFAEEERQRKSADHTWDELDKSGCGFLPTDGSFMHLARAARDNGFMSLVPLNSIDSFAVRHKGGSTKAPTITGWPNLAENPPTDERMREWLQRDRNLGWGFV